MALGHLLLMAIKYLLLGFGVPLGLVLFLTFLNRNTDAMLDSSVGWQWEVYLGWLGIIIHELSHLLLALFFGHKVTEYKLLVLPKDVRSTENGTVRLGYVNHLWNPHSPYQQLGNAFIGTAPVYGSTLAIYCVSRFLAPEWYQNLTTFAHQVINLETPTWNLLWATGISSQGEKIRVIIAVLLIMSITIGGFALSTADLASCITAFGELALIGFILILVGLLLGGNAQVAAVTQTIAQFSVSALSFSFLVSIMVNLIIRVFAIL